MPHVWSDTPRNACCALVVAVALGGCARDALTAPAARAATLPLFAKGGRRPGTPMMPTVTFASDFADLVPSTACLADGAVLGPWLVRYTGYGCAAVESDGLAAWLAIAPMASAGPEETHAPLVVGPVFGPDLTYSVSVHTTRQLRVGAPPNPWEVAWVVWHYADDDHFYYFVPKPNGWELGKRDPAYPGGQRFLATGTLPAFPIGRWYTVTVTQRATGAMSVAVDGESVVTFTDRERPYGNGRIGFYTEDAAARFTRVRVQVP
jgi:hypothetical protein